MFFCLKGRRKIWADSKGRHKTADIIRWEGSKQAAEKNVIKALLASTVEFQKYPSNQSADSYDLMRKFGIALLNDILMGRNSLVSASLPRSWNLGKKRKSAITLSTGRSSFRKMISPYQSTRVNPYTKRLQVRAILWSSRRYLLTVLFNMTSWQPFWTDSVRFLNGISMNQRH